MKLGKSLRKSKRHKSNKATVNWFPSYILLLVLCLEREAFDAQVVVIYAY